MKENLKSKNKYNVQKKKKKEVGYAGGRLLADRIALQRSAHARAVHPLRYRPAVASVMVGVKPQLEEALALQGDTTAAGTRLRGVLAAASKHAYLGQCTYLGHCAP